VDTGHSAAIIQPPKDTQRKFGAIDRLAYQQLFRKWICCQTCAKVSNYYRKAQLWSFTRLRIGYLHRASAERPHCDALA